MKVDKKRAMVGWVKNLVVPKGDANQSIIHSLHIENHFLISELV